MDAWYAMRFGLSVAMLIGIRFPDANFVESLEFDYFTFSLQWPVTFCRLHKARCNISSVPDIWTIHGLWPSNYKGANPRHCSSVFNASQIPQNAIEDLNQKWPNLNLSSTNEQFWSTQWKVHGSCAESVPGVQNISQYFTKAVELANTYNIKEILRTSHVTDGNNYTISSIQDALIQNTTRLSNITWSRAKCAMNWLFEIRICFDKRFGVINCPRVSNSTQELIYPSKGLSSAQHLRCYPPSTENSNGHLLSQLFFLTFLPLLPSVL